MGRSADYPASPPTSQHGTLGDFGLMATMATMATLVADLLKKRSSTLAEPDTRYGCGTSSASGIQVTEGGGGLKKMAKN